MSLEGSSAESTLQAMYLDGRRKWSDVDMGFPGFADHCERVLGMAKADTSSDTLQVGSRPESGVLDGDLQFRRRASLRTDGARPDQLLDRIAVNGADIYLSCACAQGNSRARQHLEAQSSVLVRSAISRVRRDPEFVRETTQFFWERLLGGRSPRIGQYAGRGPLLAWLRVVATRTALDRLRESPADADALRNTVLFEPAHSAESELTRSRYAAAFQRALTDAVSKLTRRERNVLYMHLRGPCSLDQIARVYNVHRSTVSRWLDGARSQVFTTVHQVLTRECGLSESEFDNAARLIRSELDIIVPTASLSADAERESRGQDG
ncbi:MAG TPA: sigma-70 family RNA polymerase sigma factor [Polyangiaceae bacterium]|nr:sigma-70 family RNA polymerase sigma factor [Polyangiaceae bacterium]